LVEAIGVEVVAVAGSELAFKITRPLDLVLARTVAAS
jgi:2-C-methyl-D-erythritol 4-phosphate cytidylyltransferase